MNSSSSKHWFRKDVKERSSIDIPFNGPPRDRLIQAAAASERLVLIRQKRNRIQEIYAKYNNIKDNSNTSNSYDQQSTTSTDQNRDGGKFCKNNSNLFHDNSHYEGDNASNRTLIDDRDVAASCDERSTYDNSSTSEILPRCNITVFNVATQPCHDPSTENDDNNLTSTRPKIRRNSILSKKSVSTRSATGDGEVKSSSNKNNNSVTTTTSKIQKLPKHKKKSVHFHKYDEVIDGRNQTTYVYSLYDVETEKERAEYDVVDDIENVVSDVGYFFQCLKEGLAEEATKSFRRTTTATTTTTTATKGKRRSSTASKR
jgi:hypothetical protein